MQQEQHRPASDICDIATLADRETHGLAAWWTCYQFDRAVTWFGRWMDAKLAETDADYKSKYTLSELLRDDPNDDSGLERLMAQFPELVEQE